MKNYDALYAEMNAVFAGDQRDHWLRLLRHNGVPAGPLYTLEEVFNDPQVRHLGLRQRLTHPEHGEIELVAPGLQMSETPVAIRASAPRLGEHTRELLS